MSRLPVVVIRDHQVVVIEDRIGILPAQMLKAIDAARREKAEREENERKGDGCRRRLRPARHLGRAAAGTGPKAPVKPGDCRACLFGAL